MQNADITSFPNADALADAVASSWLEEIERAHRSARAHHVALSGGRIAQRFFAAAAGRARKTGVTFEHAHFFWGDERCVPPDDPESNFRIAQQLLFEPLRIPPTHIHRVRGEESPQFASAQAESELCRIAPLNDAKQPVLDLIFLGMGEDGHVASLFPGESEETMTGKAVYRSVTAPKPPPARVTLGYLAIAAARQVWVLASGAGKEQALRESLAVSGGKPLARVLKLRERTRIFTDITI